MMWKCVVLMIFSFITLTCSIFNYPKLKMSQEKSAIYLPQPLNENLPPLIFVPSLMGCPLEAKLQNVQTPNFLCSKNSDFYQLFIDLKQFILPQTARCFADNIRMHFNKTTGYSTNKRGVTIRGKDFGGVDGIRYLDSFNRFVPHLNDFMNFLTSNGYEMGKNFRGGLIDWRKGPQDLIHDGDFQKLKSLIEETFNINGNKKVHLFGHSYGGISSTYFLSHVVTQEWKDKYIASLIAYATPYDGSISSLKSFIHKSGDTILPDYLLSIFSFLTAHLSAAGWVIPNSPKWNQKIVIQTDSRNYTMSNIQQFFIVVVGLGSFSRSKFYINKE